MYLGQKLAVLAWPSSEGKNQITLRGTAARLQNQMKHQNQGDHLISIKAKSVIASLNCREWGSRIDLLVMREVCWPCQASSVIARRNSCASSSTVVRASNDDSHPVRISLSWRVSAESIINAYPKRIKGSRHKPFWKRQSKHRIRRGASGKTSKALHEASTYASYQVAENKL